MYNERISKGNELNKYANQIKEPAIRQKFPPDRQFSNSNFLYCDPPEIILQNIEKNKEYDIPVRIHNVSNSSKRITISKPKNKVFKLKYDNNAKNSVISSGLYLQITITFDTDVLDKFEDRIIISSENDFKLPLILRAYKPEPLVQYEPLINLGFVPVNTKKKEVIEFMNDGMLEAKIELKMEKNPELTLSEDKFELGKVNSKNNKKRITISYDPRETNNLHEKIEILQSVEDKEYKETIGVIEVIATSVFQQLSVVFEEGGGPTTEINFGMLYYGQSKECSAFLVNNGPKSIEYNFFFHPDKRKEDITLDDSEYVCTPEAAGIEMTQRILSASPINGVIAPYSQIPIKFICNTKMPRDENKRVYISDEYDKIIKNEIVPTQFISTAAIKFDEYIPLHKREKELMKSTDSDNRICNPISVFMEVKCIDPVITIDKPSLNFWECKLHENKIIPLVITNRNEEIPIDFNFNKVPHFTVDPIKSAIMPREKRTITVSFHPQNYGNFSDTLVLKYINSIYSLPIKVFGLCKVKGDKKNKLMLTDKNYQDIAKTDIIVPDFKATDYTKPKKTKVDKDRHYRAFIENETNKLRNDKDGGTLEVFEERVKDFEQVRANKLKANEDLNEMYNQRMRKKDPKATLMDKLVIDERNDRLDLLEVLSNDKDNRCDSPKLKIPEPYDPLWVVKPIGKYEPATYAEMEENKDSINIDETPQTYRERKAKEKAISDKELIPNEFPKTQKEIKDCEQVLDGISLQNIKVYNDQIDFGKIFKGSEMHKTFWIRNNLRQYIFMKIETKEVTELERSYPKSLVIPPGTRHGFNLIFYSNGIKEGVYYLKYTINDHHTFKMKVLANVVPVKVEPRNTSFHFQFKNEKNERVETSVIHRLILTNKGNAAAKIRWEENRLKCFDINPRQAIVEPNKDFITELSFTPTEPGTKQDLFEDLKCLIENGNPFTIRVSASLPPVNVSIQGLPDNTIDFKNVTLGDRPIKEFQLKNESKSTAAYIIKNSQPSLLKFKEECGYIDRDKVKTISCAIESNEEHPDFQEDVEIFIRGGPRLVLRIKACIIQPQVFIVQDSFDFGEVELNEQAVRLITFANKSDLFARISVNLVEDFEDFFLELDSKHKNENHQYIELPEKDKQDFVSQDMDEEEEENEESENDNYLVDSPKQFNIVIPPQSQVDFKFIFRPTSSAKNSEFMTNFKLGTYSCKGLERKVLAKKISSCIIIHPNKQEILFNKTFIYGSDKSVSEQFVRIINISVNGRLRWYIDTSEIEKEMAFKCHETKGELLNSEDACTIKFTFTPLIKKTYDSKAYLNVIDEKGKKTVKTLKLIGEGTLPRLCFDKRVLILPIVPLDFESSVKFKIINEGYEATKISHTIRQENGTIPLTVIYHDDAQIDYHKTELRMELKFQSAVPLSFTCKLVFFDQDQNEFPIMVAGTTENCIFTNYSYFQRNLDNLIIVDEGETFKLKRNTRDIDIDEMDGEGSKHSTSFMSTVTTKNTNNLGFKRIKRDLLENNCKFLKKFLRVICPNSNLKNPFPEVMMKDNGDLLFEFILNLTGKAAKGRVFKIEGDKKFSITLRGQYFELIKDLQIQGAFLTTVFPEYLLSFADFKKYVISDGMTERIMEQNWEKGNKLQQHWKYLNKESWITLIYQILKIFYLARVNSKTFPMTIRHLNELIYEKYISMKLVKSNVFSQNEIYLIRWLQANYEAAFPNSQKIIKSFDDIYQDGQIMSALYQTHFPKYEEPVKTKKKEKDQKLASASKILEFFNNYGIYTHLKTTHMSNEINKHMQDKPPKIPNMRDLLLFAIMLYQNLQHFIPKENIVYSCILGDIVTKSIQLLNTGRKIEYEVSLEGSQDFVLNGGKEIKLESGTTLEYPVQFKSRLSQKVEARLFFINKNFGWNNQAAPLVYNLVSNVTGRRSIKPTEIIKTQLYERVDYRLIVKSPFPERGQFDIKLYQTKKLIPNKKKAIKKNEKKDEANYKIFFLKSEETENKPSIILDKETEKSVIISFLPIDLDTYECNVVFVNERIGEFQYSIEGSASVPKYFEKWERECEVDDNTEFTFELKAQNTKLLNALQLVKPEKIMNNTNSNIKKTQLNERNVFSVVSSKPQIFQVAPLLYPGGYEMTEPDKTRDMNNTDKLNTSKIETLALKVKFNSKIVNNYESEFTLTNVDKPNDIRVYKLVVNVKPKPILLNFDFNCPLRESITQKIPIYNNSEKEWILNMKLTQPQIPYNFFKLSPENGEKRIPRKSTGEISLTFSPTEKYDMTAKLIINNKDTKEVYEYKINGKVDDPLAEGHINIICKTKSNDISETITLDNNTDKDVTYTVETDLGDVIKGPNSFTIRPFTNGYQYKFSVYALLGKTYFGQITFTDDKKNYRWYTIRIVAESSWTETQVYEMKTYIRNAIYREISIVNPLNEYVSFSINYEGNFLFGDNEIRIEPKKTAIFRLSFLPLEIGSWEGKIHIYNERVDEFLYRFRLIAEDAAPIYPETMKAELGKSKELKIYLDNPHYEEVKVYFDQPNKLFKVMSDDIILPANGNKEVTIVYSPSTMDIEEECQLVFQTEKIGNWVYNLKGRGTLPTPMDVSQINTYVGGITSGNISFKNPFNEKITVWIDLKCDEWPGTFGLLNKKEKYQIDPFKTLLITYTFSPQKLTKFAADLYVYVSKSLFWRYPIEGITEVKSKGIYHTFKTKAKKALEERILLDLSDLPEGENIDSFTPYYNVKEDKYRSLVDKCFHVKIDQTKSKDKEYDKNKLPLIVKFSPLRPFKTEVEFIVSKQSGGQWIYNFILEGTEPAPDDIINIQSSLNHVAHVSFKLQNYFTKNAKFVAYFSHDSTSEFSVKPREGILDQSGKEGTTFIISYLPVEYGKVKVGKLIIETDEIQWIFEIRGSHLDYKPPEIKSSNLMKATASTKYKQLK